MVTAFYSVLLIYKDYTKYCTEKVKLTETEDNKQSNMFGENMANRIAIGSLNTFRPGFAV